VKTDTSTSKLIYNAQCYGNVEPIEYMVPYPNLRGLITGQNVKYANHFAYKDVDLTNKHILDLVNQTANWLESLGLTHEHRVLIYGFDFPYAELMSFGIWSVGASLVITDEKITSAIGGVKPDFILDGNEWDYPECLLEYPTEYVHKINRLLPDEAMVFWSKKRGIKLSHYNLLVNANGFYLSSGLNETKSFHIDLPPMSTAWAVFQVVLPFYTGAVLTTENPDMKIGLPDQFPNPDYELYFDWSEIKDGYPAPVFIRPENTAVLTIGEEPNHMTKIENTDKAFTVTGHSVMMGYLDETQNESAFTEKGVMV